MNRRPVPALDMRPARHLGSTTLSGLWTPPSSTAGGGDPGSRYGRTFVTYSELGGGPVDKQWITSRLQKMSAYDCLQALGRLSCMIDAAPLADVDQQLRIMDRLGWVDAVKQAAEPVLRGTDGRSRAIFFPQQVVHLARLAVIHADPRPMDGFGGGKLANDFTLCVLAVTELLGENVDLEREENQVSWILRQTAINDRPDSVALWTRYYDIFVRTWEQVATPEAFKAAEAFKRFSGISIERWLVVGFALYGQFLGYGTFQSENFFIVPPQFFSATPVKRAEWESLLALSAASLDQTRTAVLEEEARLGPTKYRCQSFEQRPLLRVPGEVESVIPLAVDSYERHVTEGIFWILSDGAMGESRAREHFSGAFGHVFEECVQRTFERAVPAIGTPRVHRARNYRSAHGDADSTDVVLDYEPDAVFVEVVAKRPQSATLTRGDYETFRRDLNDGVLKKAKQLDRNIRDFRAGRLVLGTVDPKRITRIFPVILAIEGFPSMPPIPQIIDREIAAKGLLRGLPPVAVLGAEELAAIEAFMEQGVTFVELLRRWKIESGYAGLPFGNFTDMSPDLTAKIEHRARYQEECWRELVELIHADLFSAERRSQT